MYKKNGKYRAINGMDGNKYKKSGRARLLLSIVLVSSTLLIAAMSPVFTVKEIKVYGNTHCIDLDIISTSGIIEGENALRHIGGSIAEIITLRYGQAEESIKQRFPYIGKAVVKYIIPGTVVIRISERKAAAAVTCSGGYLLVDRKAHVVESVVEKPSLPVIDDLSFISFKLGQALELEDMSRFDGIIGLIETIRASDSGEKAGLLDSIQYFRSADKEIHFLVDSRIYVIFPAGGDIEYNIRLLREIVFNNLALREKGVLDFTMGSEPVFIPEVQGE